MKIDRAKKGARPSEIVKKSKLPKKFEKSEAGRFVAEKKAPETFETAKRASKKAALGKKKPTDRANGIEREAEAEAEPEPEPEPETREEAETKVADDVISKSLEVLRRLEKIGDKKRNALFDEAKPIILQVECVKIPKMVGRKLRFSLPHWLLTDASEVCLFVSDLKRGKRVDHEPTVRHYEDLLKEKGISIVKSVIPVRQLRVEYDQAETKRRLLTQHDFFLADAKVGGLLAHKLGMTFFRKNRLPTPVRMDSKDLKKEIETALHKSAMKLPGVGQTYTLHVANGKHSDGEVLANVKAALRQLVDKFPGGWDNVRTIYIKYPLSMAIPIYMTLKNKNSIEDIVIKPPKPVNDVVEDELSTILGAKVKVFPKGRVSVKIDKSDVDDSDDDDDCRDKKVMEKGDGEEPQKKRKKNINGEAGHGDLKRRRLDDENTGTVLDREDEEEESEDDDEEQNDENASESIESDDSVEEEEDDSDDDSDENKNDSDNENGDVDEEENIEDDEDDDDEAEEDDDESEDSE